MGSKRVGHNRATEHTHTQPLLIKFSVFCESGASLQSLSFSILYVSCILKQPLPNQ